MKTLAAVVPFGTNVIVSVGWAIYTMADDKRELSMARVAIGSTVFVQACAKMMSAAWIERQMLETSTAPGMSTSGVAYALRHTIASDIGMAFELALKSLAQGLSPNKDGEPQVPHGHNLPDIWLVLPRHVRDEIDRNVEQLAYRKYDVHGDLQGKILPFAKYLEKHKEFLNKTVDNRYALERGETWMSEVLFVDRIDGGQVSLDTFMDGKQNADGIGVLTAYWYAIMTKALALRWPKKLCDSDEGFRTERDEARALMDRAAHQMTGRLGIMTEQELTDQRLRQ